MNIVTIKNHRKVKGHSPFMQNLLFLIRVGILGFYIFLISGCIGKKHLELKSVNLVTEKELYIEYSNHNIKNNLVKSLNQMRKENDISNTFLKIEFLSKEKLSLDESNSQVFLPVVDDKILIASFHALPLEIYTGKSYLYTYYFPDKQKLRGMESYNNYSLQDIKDNTFFLQDVNQFSLTLSVTDGYTPNKNWRSNKLIITKEMIRELYKKWGELSNKE